MRSQLEIIEKIDAYILGNLSPADAQIMTDELKNSSELKEIYETQKIIQQAARRQAILEQVQHFAPSIAPTLSFWTKFKWPIIFSSIIITLLAAGLIINSISKDETELNNASNTSSSTEQKNKKESNLNSEKDNAYSAKKSTPFRPTTPTKTTKTNNSPGGLHTWTMPEIQHFTIDPKKSNTLECNEGTLIIVPPNAVVDNDGKPIEEFVQLEVIEALTIDKMIAYNLTTQANGEALTSGGMLYLQPYSNGEKVNFSKDTPCHIQIPTDDFNGEMKTWEGKVDKKGNINWENPKAINNYLIPVDFSTLDFVPTGFRPYFQAQLPFENYTKSSVALEDSFYYSLGSTVSIAPEPVNQKNTTQGVERNNIEEETNEFPIKISENKIVSKTATLSIPDFVFKQNGNNHVDFVADNKSIRIKMNQSLYANVEMQNDKPITGIIIAKTSDCDSLIIPNVTLQLYKVTKVFLSDGECQKASKPDSSIDPICYIHPSSIKALRQPKFSNTFIATREFEERLQLLHTLKNAEPLLELYVENIDKNMYEIDAMVAQKLTGKNRIIFEELAKEKLTNVDLTNTHLDAIQEYYHSSRKQFQAEARKAQENLNAKSKAELLRLSQELSELQTEYFSNYQKTIPNGASPISSRVLPKKLANRIPRNNVATQANYKISWYSSGWMNIDNYIHLLSKGEKIIPVLANSQSKNLRLYQCINSLKTVVGLNSINGNYEAHYPSAKNPENVHFNSTYCVGISKNDDEIKFGSSIFNANQVSNIALSWEKVSEDELMTKLKALSPFNDKLAQSVIDEKERIAKQLLLKEQQEARERERIALEKEFNENKAAIISAQNKIIEQQEKHARFVQMLIDFIDPCCEKENNTATDMQPITKAESASAEIVGFPTVDASFAGGNSALQKYIANNTRYPQEALDKNLSGTIYVHFIVDADGNIFYPTISNPNPTMASLEKEALRLVKEMPKWVAASNNGSNVYTKVKIPIKFSMK